MGSRITQSSRMRVENNSKAVTSPIPVRLIAIVGGSGSGKTWLARRLKRRFGKHAGILALDDFYTDLSHLPLAQRERLNFDDPAAIEWSLVHKSLQALITSRKVPLPRYDFTTHTRKTEIRIWRPRPIVILDGLWLLHRPELRQLYALSIYVDCPESLRLERRLQRDQKERGRTQASILRQFKSQVAPMHNLHVEAQKKHVDLVLPSPISRSDIDRVWQQVSRWR